MHCCYCKINYRQTTPQLYYRNTQRKGVIKSTSSFHMLVERLTICFICEFTSFIYNSCAKKHDIIIIIEFRGFVKPPASISVRCYLIEISSAEMKSAPSITPSVGKVVWLYRIGSNIKLRQCLPKVLEHLL